MYKYNHLYDYGKAIPKFFYYCRFAVIQLGCKPKKLSDKKGLHKFTTFTL